MMEKVICLTGVSPEDLSNQVNQTLETLEEAQREKAQVTFSHVEYDRHISFFAYLAY